MYTQEHHAISTERPLREAHVAAVLRDLRKVAGFSQEYVSQALHVDQANLSRMERGVQRITVEQLLRLSALFQIAVQEVFSMAEQYAKRNHT